MASNRILLVRASISSLASIISELPSFAHPYITKTITVLLPLFLLDSKFPHNSIDGDIKQCLHVIATSISSRLLIPITVQCMSSEYAKGHIISKNFLLFQKDMFTALDRSTVVNHMQSLSLLMITSLNYRTLYGDQTGDGDAVDSVAVDCCIELCLKFTESELKVFINRLMEWCGGSDNSAAVPLVASYGSDSKWKRYSKHVVFYSLMKSLNNCLRTIFVPTMLSLWFMASENLNEAINQSKTVNIQKYDAIANTNYETSSKKSKKRKVVNNEVSEVNELTYSENKKIINEILFFTEPALESIRLCCVNDQNGLIDQVM